MEIKERNIEITGLLPSLRAAGEAIQKDKQLYCFGRSPRNDGKENVVGGTRYKRAPAGDIAIIKKMSQDL